MATYVPNATQATEPTESRSVESAALEFRTLKESVTARVDALQFNIDDLEAQVEAGDASDLRVPEAAVAPLPVVSARAGKVLGFDGAGNPTMVAVSGTSDPSLRADLAQDAGASLVGADDAASGSLFTTVQGFITRLRSSAGAALVGFIQAGVGAVSRTLQSKAREVVSVKDFGAVGDGIADDTAAIQLAVNYGFCFFPEGTYKITDALISTGPNLVMKGADVAISKIVMTGVASPILSISGTKQRFCVEGLTFDGGSHGIYYTGGNNVDKAASITCCKFNNQTNGSIYFDESGFINGKIENVEIASDAKYGIYFQGNRTMNAVKIRAVRVSGCVGVGSVGIYINNTVAPGSSSTAKYVRLDSVTFENNQGRALFVRCADVSAESLYFENNGTVYDVPEVGLDSDYNVSYLAYASLHVHNMVFAERGAARTTNTRVEFLNHGVRFLAYASTAPAGGATVDVKGYAILNQLFLNMTDFSVINATNLGNNFRAGASIKTGAIESTGAITTTETVTATKSLAATTNGYKLRFAQAAAKTYTLGTSVNTTDLDINAGTAGQSVLCIASRNTGSGSSTDSALYLVRTGHSGDFIQKYYISGSSDFVTFSASGTKMAVSIAAGSGLITVVSNRQEMIAL